MFRAIYVDRKLDGRSPTFASLADFYSRYGVTAEDFTATSRSFGIEAKLKRNEALIKAYGVDGVTIERRKPTDDEFLMVIGELQDPGLLERTWNGVVAHSPSGEPIGVLRIIWDAPAWFSIWDVAVLPEWQGRRIGSTMMKEALEMIREASTGAIVHLFTYKHGFYERLGFTKETVSMRRL